MPFVVVASWGLLSAGDLLREAIPGFLVCDKSNLSPVGSTLTALMTVSVPWPSTVSVPVLWLAFGLMNLTPFPWFKEVWIHCLRFRWRKGEQVSNQAAMVKEETANPSQEWSKNRILPLLVLEKSQDFTSSRLSDQSISSELVSWCWFWDW